MCMTYPAAAAAVSAAHAPTYAPVSNDRTPSGAELNGVSERHVAQNGARNIPITLCVLQIARLICGRVVVGAIGVAKHVALSQTMTKHCPRVLNDDNIPRLQRSVTRFATHTCC